MKKNMMSVIILALVGLNVILTGIVMFVAMPSLTKVNNLVTDVASIIDLEISSDGGENGAGVSIADTEVFTIENAININLKSEEGSSKMHYAAIDSISVSMNKKAEDFTVISGSFEANKDAVTEIVSNCYANYTLETANSNRAAIKEEILEKVRAYFGTTCITNISFGNLRFQ